MQKLALDREQDWLTRWDYAHRGLHDEHRPENSMPAFEAAVEAGYGIELDVHQTRDGEVVVFHDDDLKRMTGVPGRIESMLLTDLRSLQLGRTGETIPRLSDVLSLVRGRVPLLIEIKEKQALGLDGRTMQLLDGYRGQFAVQSFSPLSVRWFRRNAPAVLRGQLSGLFRPPLPDVSRAAQRALRNLTANCIGRPDFVNYEWQGLGRHAVQRLRRKGMPILAWTVRSRCEEDEARALCDAVVFEGYRPLRRGSQ